ncbi:glutamate receptor: ionotropic kainate 3-like protein [Leptotrombidium deliense]|uniref:Glutamate receptor: ionotropic kainate 3-like protein n=1 Tax=Leptotrombidium deliense TaxID=299467 RepID=A0A443RYU4_9ACAR|nr:glutamate receptor: ionotropic kainate 3-like protein [Leptotrombidium deliense]
MCSNQQISRRLPEFRKYIVSSIISKPFLSLKKNSYLFKGNERFEGFCVDLLEHISVKIGFNYEIVLVNDDNYGVRQLNGKWNGIVGEILTKV